MNEVLVKLYVPTIGEQYDIWLKVNKKIQKIWKNYEKSIDNSEIMK